MKTFKFNWYNFVHEKIEKRFGTKEFLNSFCVEGESQPVAVYRVKTRNPALGHLDYLLLSLEKLPENGESILKARGMTEYRMGFNRYQEAILCLKCDEVMVSIVDGDVRTCTCGGVSVDGGAQEFRYVGDYGEFEIVTMDMISDRVIRMTCHTSH